MQKIGDTTKTADSNGEFTDGDPQKQIPCTWIMSSWLNTLQRELIKVVQEGGLTLNPKDDTQLYQAIERLTGKAVEGLVKSVNSHRPNAIGDVTLTAEDVEAMPQRPFQDVLSPVWFKIVTFDGDMAGRAESRLEFELSGASYANAGVKEMSIDRVHLSLNDVLNTQRITSATVGNVIRQVSSGKKINPSEFLVGVTEEVDANKKTTRYTFWLGKTVYHASTLTLNMLTQQPFYAVVTTDFSASDAQTMTEPAGIVYARREETFTTDNPQLMFGVGTGPIDKADAYSNIGQIYRVSATAKNKPPAVTGNVSASVLCLPMDAAPSAGYFAVVGGNMAAYVGFSQKEADGITWSRIYTDKYLPPMYGLGGGGIEYNFDNAPALMAALKARGSGFFRNNKDGTGLPAWAPGVLCRAGDANGALVINPFTGNVVAMGFTDANTTAPKVNTLYGTLNPPTPEGINAVKKTGDTMTGQLIAPSVATTPEAMPHGAGAYVDQLSLQAPFFQPNWQWPVNAGGLFVPIAKGTSTRKGQGYPTAVSFGYLMPANHEHAHPTIHAKGDSNVDAAWDFNPYNGNISSKAGTFATQEWVNALIQNVGDMSVNGDRWWARLNLNGGTLIVQGGFVNGQTGDDGVIERVPLNISVPNRLLGVWTIVRNYAQGYETTWNPQVQDLSGARDAFSWLHGTKERMIYWIAVGH